VVEKVLSVHVPDVFMNNSLLAVFPVRFTVSKPQALDSAFTLKNSKNEVKNPVL
jgi:hypothetical protein